MGGKTSRRLTEPGRPLSIGAIVIGGVLVGVVGAVAVAALLYFYGAGTETDRVGLDVVRTAGTLLVGTGGAVALLLAARRQRYTELTLEHQREVAATAAQDAVEQRMTELYTRAVDQLGNNQAPVRLGGLHALERLAQGNPTQRQTIVDVICAYLRMPYTPPANEPPSEGAHPMILRRYDQQRQELQVRLTAQRILIAHLRRSSEGEAFWPDIDLDLTGAHLHRFDLTGCSIRNAQFGGALFDGFAAFAGTHFLGRTEFDGARFFGEAWFPGAQFWYAGFAGAHFSGDAWFGVVTFYVDADFRGAQVSGDAIFVEAEFHGNVKFDETQINGKAVFDGARAQAKTNSTRIWPPPWTTREESEREKDWLYLHLVHTEK